MMIGGLLKKNFLKNLIKYRTRGGVNVLKSGMYQYYTANFPQRQNEWKTQNTELLNPDPGLKDLQ